MKFNGRGRVREKHPQHSKPCNGHGYLHHPSHQKLVVTETPCLDATVAAATGILHRIGVLLHCFKSSIGDAKNGLSLTILKERCFYFVFFFNKTATIVVLLFKIRYCLTAFTITNSSFITFYISFKYIL